MKFDPREATWVLSCTDAGLAAVVGDGAFSRGLDYATRGQVLAIATADRGRVLTGTVAGNRLAPYQTLVTHKGGGAARRAAVDLAVHVPGGRGVQACRVHAHLGAHGVGER